jgi:hypothetical protein
MPLLRLVIIDLDKEEDPRDAQEDEVLEGLVDHVHCLDAYGLGLQGVMDREDHNKEEKPGKNLEDDKNIPLREEQLALEEEHDPYLS